MIHLVRTFPLLLILCWSPWHRGGMHSPAQDLLLWFTPLLVLPWVIRLPSTHGPLRGQLHRLTHSPLFYASVSLGIIITCQWVNSGRTLTFSPTSMNWVASSPPIPWLPSSFDHTRWEPREYLNWFIPGMALFCTLRFAGWDKNELGLLIHLPLINGCLLGIVGIAGALTSRDNLHQIFASFGYQNHAAQYFVLLAAIHLGTMAYALKRHQRSWKYWTLSAFMQCVFLCATVLSLSRTGFVCLAVLAAATLFWSIRHSGRTMHPRALIPALLAVGTCAIIILLLLRTENSARLLREWDNLTVSKMTESLKGEGRKAQILAGVDMWKEDPIFGLGAWGYRHTLSQHLDQKHSEVMDKGSANAHCDPVQFLAELGLIGAVALFLFPLHLLVLAFRGKVWLRSAAAFSCLGLGLLAAWSFVDLPFRNAVILHHAFFTAAWIPFFLPGLSRDEPGKSSV